MMGVFLGTELQVSKLGLGSLPLSGAYGSVDEELAVRRLLYAIDRGITLIDTADVYGAGRSEIVIGRAIALRRGQVKVSTKFGLRALEQGVFAEPSVVRPAVQNSLRRLGVERIDLLFLHRVDPKVPIEETVGAMADLVQEGCVGHLGLSEVTSSEITRAAAVHEIAAVQSEWSIWSRDVESAVVPAVARIGAGFVASSPLGRGFLAGNVEEPGCDDQRRRVPRLVSDARAANLAVAEAISNAGRSLGATSAQVAIAWLRQTGTRMGLSVVPIPGTQNENHIDENLAALDMVLPVSTMVELNLLASRVFGARGPHPEWLSVGREETQSWQ